MNRPPYIIVDVMADVVAAVATKLEREINYQYGYVTELAETLQQYSGSTALMAKKYPLVWLSQPFTITTGALPQMYGEIDELRLFVITGTSKTSKAAKRMEDKYKPLLYPIMWELFDQIARSDAFTTYRERMNSKITDRYYWGENQQNVLNDAVDVIEIKIYGLKVNSRC